MRKRPPVAKEMVTCFSHPSRKAVAWKHLARVYGGVYTITAGWCLECVDSGEPDVLVEAHSPRTGFGTVSRGRNAIVGDLAQPR
jgi:hypothetical protein